MSHHPSCRPTDKDLVWHCHQCGESESAEALLDLIERQRKALEQIAKQGALGPAQPRIDTTTMQKLPVNPYYEHCRLLAEIASATLAQDAPQP